MNYFKEKILPPLLVAILIAMLTALVKIYFAVASIPDMQKQIDDLKIEVKSLNRRVTNNQTEIFYLIMGKPKPNSQNN